MPVTTRMPVNKPSAVPMSPLAASAAARGNRNGNNFVPHGEMPQSRVQPNRVGMTTRLFGLAMMPYSFAARALSAVNMTAMGAQLFGIVGAVAVGSLNLGGKLFGKVDAGAGLNRRVIRVQNALISPMKFMTSKKLEDLPHMASGVLDSVGNKASGRGWDRVGESFSNAGNTLKGWETTASNAIGTHSQRLFDRIGDGVDRVVGQERLDRWAGRFDKKAAAHRFAEGLHLQEANAHANAAVGLLQGTEATAARGMVKEMQHSINSGAHKNPELFGKSNLGDFHPGDKKHLGAFETALGMQAGGNTESFNDKDFRTQIQEQPAFDHAGKMTQHAIGAVQNAQQANIQEGRADLTRRHFHTLGDRLKKTDLMTAAYVGTTVVSTAISSAAIARMARNRMSIAKEMHEDITGRKASTFKLLFGSLPKEMRSVRTSLMKEVLPQIGMQAASLALSLGLIRSGNGKMSFMINMFGFQGMSMAANFLASSSPLAHYEAIKDGLSIGQDVPPALYAGFLARVSPDAKAAGEQNRLTRALAMEYAAEKMTPAAIIDEIHQGAFNKRALNIKAKWDAVAKPVKGDHTAKVIGGRMDAALAKPAAAGIGAG